MAVINHKYQFVFLAEPHTGSRAVRDALCKLEGSVETNGNHHIDLFGCVSAGYLSHDEAELFTVFSAVRDPHDVLVSRWLYHNRKVTPFANFVDRARVSEQIGYSGDIEGTLFWRTYEQVDWFVRYETLHKGLNVLLASLGAPVIEELPFVGKSEGRPDWRDLWSTPLESYARKHFPDVRRYHYKAYNPGCGWRSTRHSRPWLVTPKRGD